MELKAYKKKTLKYSFLFISILIFAIPALIYVYLRISRPDYDGKVITNKVVGKVEVIRDRYGIPHIKAENDLDGFYVLGQTIAADRLFQMEITRRVANGELSEVVGDKGLSSDKLFRTLRLRKTMEEMLAKKKLDPELIQRSEAFYRGVNDYQYSHPLPIEFKILGIKPRPFTIQDGYSFIGLMSFSFAIGLSQDVLFSAVEKRIGHELVNEMRGDRGEEKTPSKHKVFVQMNNKYKSEIPQIISFLENSFTLFDGSNGWLLSKSRMQNNANLLANDPHITYTHPGIWYEAHLKTPKFENYGHYLPLIPIPILAHNQNRAFGLTMSLIDDMDLYKEQISNNKYIYKGQEIPLKEEVETIKVRGEKDVILKIRSSIHGPILDEVNDEKSLALKWLFYDENNDPISSLYSMLEAKNMDEFKKGVASGVTPGLNVLYADKDNIGWWIFGKVEIKPKNVKSDYVLEGSLGNDEPIRAMRFEEKPFSENPDTGVIVSANNRPQDFPAEMRGDFQPDDRYLTISTMLNQKKKWTEEEIKEIQTLSVNFENKRILAALLDDLKITDKNKVYIDLLKNWDLVSNEDSVAASIYFLLINKIGQNVLGPELTINELEAYGKITPSYTFIKRIILDKNNIWWKKFNRVSILNKSLNDSVETLKKKLGDNIEEWKWGRLHTITFNHPLGKIKPFDWIFNLGPYPLSGSNQDITNQKFNLFKDDFWVTAGPSTRRIISFAHIGETYGILPIGESGHILSPYYKDQVEMFLKNEYRPMLLNETAIKAQKRHLIEYTPLKN